MKEKDFKEILERLDKMIMNSGIENVKAQMHFQAISQHEEAEICSEKAKICNILHEIIRNGIKKK